MENRPEERKEEDFISIDDLGEALDSIFSEAIEDSSGESKGSLEEEFYGNLFPKDVASAKVKCFLRD